MNLTTEQAALALGVSRRVVDNLLSREASHLMPRRRRGRTRRVSGRVLEHLAVALLLARDARIPLRHSIRAAGRILDSEEGDAPLGTLARLRFDVPALRRVLRVAIADAVAEVPPPPRGRPRRKAERGVR